MLIIDKSILFSSAIQKKISSLLHPTIQMLYSGKNERQEKETTTKRAQQSPYPSSPSPIEAFRGTVPVRLYPSQPLSRSYTKIKKEKKERKQKETSLESLSTSRTFFFFFFCCPLQDPFSGLCLSFGIGPVLGRHGGWWRCRRPCLRTCSNLVEHIVRTACPDLTTEEATAVSVCLG